MARKNENTIAIRNVSNSLVRTATSVAIVDKILTEQVQRIFNDGFCLLNKINHSSAENFCFLLENNPLERIERDFTYDALNDNDCHQAICRFSEAITIKPLHVISYEMRGIAKHNIKDFSGAIDDFSKAITIDAHYAFAYNSRGNTKRSLKNYDGAIQDFLKAIDLDPHNFNPYIGLGNVNFDMEQYVAAEEHFRKALQIADTFERAFLGVEGAMPGLMSVCKKLNKSFF
jgi:tetratricopeptide (TPR) repeat protein